MNIALVYGGISSEHEISCLSAKTIYQALDPERYNVTLIFITKDGQWKLVDHIQDYTEEECSAFPTAVLIPSKEDLNFLVLEEPVRRLHIDLGFPVLHGLGGEDGTIQGLFEMAGIPYVGCGVIASAAAMDKITAKKVVAPLGIRQARFVDVYRHELNDMDAIVARVEEKLAYPVFVKPSNAGSSVGVSQAKDRTELAVALHTAAVQDKRILVEESIIGHEVECAVLGNLDVAASRVGEILAADSFYTYDAKYNNPESETVIADYLPEETIQEIRKDAVQIFKALDGSGLARVDFFVEKETGEVVFNEINTFPGFTSISMYPTLWIHEGFTIEGLVDKLIQLGLERERK